MTKPAALQRHWFSAVLAKLGFRGFSGCLAFFRRFVARNLFSVLTFGISRARHEASELAPLDNHRTAAFFANLVRWDFLLLQVLHVLGSALQILLEFLVKLVERLDPGHLAVFDLVKLLFHASGVLDVEDILKVLHEHFGHNCAKFGRSEFALVFRDVFAILNRRQNRRVC